MPGFNTKAMNAALTNGRIDGFQKSFPRGGDFKFKTLYLSSLADGAHDIRLLPRHPTLCPMGFARVVTHKVEVQMNANPVEVFCTYNPSDDTSKCAICDLLEANQDDLDSMNSELKDILTAAAPRVKFIFPAVAKIIPDPNWKHSGETDDTGNKKKEYPPFIAKGDARQGVMLSIDQGAMRKDGTRGGPMPQLFDIMKEYPDCNDMEEGYWLRFIKNGRDPIQIRVHKNPSPLDAKSQELMNDKDYPKLHPHPKFMSKSTKALDYKGQDALLDSCWWIGQLGESEDNTAVLDELGGDASVPWDDDELV